MEEIKIGTS